MSNSLFKLPNNQDIKGARIIIVDNADKNINKLLSNVFIPPNLSNCIMFKKSFFHTLLKEEKHEYYLKNLNKKEQRFELLMNLIVQSVYINNLFEKDLIFWYFDCDDKQYEKELYYECYGFNIDDINKLRSVANIPDKVFEYYEKVKKNTSGVIIGFTQNKRGLIDMNDEKHKNK